MIKPIASFGEIKRGGIERLRPRHEKSNTDNFIDRMSKILFTKSFDNLKKCITYIFLKKCFQNLSLNILMLTYVLKNVMLIYINITILILKIFFLKRDLFIEFSISLNFLSLECILKYTKTLGVNISVVRLCNIR